MQPIRFLCCLLVLIMMVTVVLAHPGSGIVVDKNGQVYFTDTGKGVWKIDSTGKLVYIPGSRFHWMTIDPMGHFAGSPKSFGQHFERVTPQQSKPALIMCSDFPLVVSLDGNIYYANTRHDAAGIIRRSPEGKESVLAAGKIFAFVNGIAIGPDSAIYITESSDPNANTVRRISRNGNISVIATFTGKIRNDAPLETTPAYCRGLCIDASGTIYVSATGNRSVLKITPDGKQSIILEEQDPWMPTGVAVYKGAIYVLEWHDVPVAQLEVREAWIPRVRKIGPDGTISTLATISR
jgi:sugar lactone lactonase YvrE